MWLYFLLLAFSFAGPLLLSFDKKVAFYKFWKYFFPVNSIVLVLFITVDVFFTKSGFWGFNPSYHLNTLILHLPLEEWMFFIVIPYASVFIHYCLMAYFPKLLFSRNLTHIISALFVVVAVLGIVFYNQRAYTLYASLLVIASMAVTYAYQIKILQLFYISFIIILIPFTITNGILTGTGIEGEVVWYNNSENVHLRILTIPIEDFFYGFSLILLNLTGMEYLRNRKKIDLQ